MPLNLRAHEVIEVAPGTRVILLPNWRLLAGRRALISRNTRYEVPVFWLLPVVSLETAWKSSRKHI